METYQARAKPFKWTYKGKALCLTIGPGESTPNATTPIMGPALFPLLPRCWPTLCNSGISIIISNIHFLAIPSASCNGPSGG